MDISINHIYNQNVVHHIFFSYIFRLSSKYFEMYYPMDISITNIVSGYPWDIFIPFSHEPLPPWEPCGSFGPGLPRPSLLHPSPLLCSTPQSPPHSGPQTRFALPKLPQPLVHLVDVASYLAQRVGCICQPMWELAAPELTKLVWDGQKRVANEK